MPNSQGAAETPYDAMLAQYHEFLSTGLPLTEDASNNYLMLTNRRLTWLEGYAAASAERETLEARVKELEGLLKTALDYIEGTDIISDNHAGDYWAKVDFRNAAEAALAGDGKEPR